MSSPGIAAQLTSTSGPSERGLCAWTHRATSSLPVPGSPVMRMRASVGATRATVALMRAIAGLSPTIGVRSARASSRTTSRRRLFSTWSCPRESAPRTETSSRLRSGGFSRKSTAPSCVASTAVSTVPWPEIITTGMPTSASWRALRTSMPSRFGILMSSSSRSTPPACAFASASSPSTASRTA